jgi:GMP synthase (glutamine-hydrolysing)
VWRQPFPGPGLGVRIIGEVTPDKVATLQHADEIVRHEIKAAGLEREIWQAFAVLADIRSVGVMGDERTYGRPIIIRAVTSDDAMTADWARLPYDLLEKMSSRIINECQVSTGWSTTSPQSRLAQLSGNSPRGLKSTPVRL